MSKPLKINLNFQGVTPVECPKTPSPWVCSWKGWDLIQNVDSVQPIQLQSGKNYLPWLEVSRAVENATGIEDDYVILMIDEAQIDELRQLAGCTVITFNGAIAVEELLDSGREFDAELNLEQYGVELSYEGIDKVLIYRHDGEQGPHWQTVVL